jgi:hypothetical protein
MKRKVIRVCSSSGGRDALCFLSDVNDHSGWTIGRGESARGDIFYIPAILVAGSGVAWRCRRMSIMCERARQKSYDWCENFDNTGSILPC